MKTIRHLRGVWKGKKKKKPELYSNFALSLASAVTRAVWETGCLEIGTGGVSGIALGTYFWEKSICIQLAQLLQSCMSVVEVKLGA